MTCLLILRGTLWQWLAAYFKQHISSLLKNLEVRRVNSFGRKTQYFKSSQQYPAFPGFNSNELLMYNAIMSLPVLIVLTYVSGELGKSLPALVKAIEGGFLWLFLAALIMGSTLNYALFFCTIWNSALTTTIVGNLRSLLGTVSKVDALFPPFLPYYLKSCFFSLFFVQFLGFFLLGGVKATFFMVFGVIINAAGGVWYTAIQYHLKRKNAVVGSTSR